MLLSIIYIALGFAAMEFSGWFIHKYVMHGPLWMIHKTHHQHSKSFFEWNDLFSLLFGSIAVLLIFLGVETLDYRFWMGIGISLYGALYIDLVWQAQSSFSKRDLQGTPGAPQNQ
jgi:beta-carotene 3-hydroxylase